MKILLVLLTTILLSSMAFASPEVNISKSRKTVTEEKFMAVSEGQPAIADDDEDGDEDEDEDEVEKLSLKSDDALPSPMQRERTEDRNSRY